MLTDEAFRLRQERKGGAANLMLAALLLEATRMLDDGMDPAHVEAIAKKTFGSQRGFLILLEEAGIGNVYDFLEKMADASDAQDIIFLKYFNFFKPSKSLTKKKRDFEKAVDKAGFKWLKGGFAEKEPDDFMLADLIKKRFMAVSFITAVELVEAEILELADVEKLCKEVWGWQEGPFAMMNRIGIQEAMRMVTEKMEMSHRQEINFPIPKLLIEQAQKNEPWPLNSKIT
jgi:3-hydroxyacyl-CoA dehydrogenase